MSQNVGSPGALRTYPSLATFPSANLAGNGAVAQDISNGQLYVSDGSAWQPYTTGSVPIPVSVPNGGTGKTSLTNHAVLLGAGTAAVNNVAQALDGQVLRGNTDGDPSFSSSPTLGVGGTTPGTLGISNGGGGGAVVTVQATGVTSAYNFNLPDVAGNAGQPLLSGGGTSSSQTYGTLGIGAGGTGQVTANAALNALLPSQAAQANKVLKTDGTNTSWTAVAASAGGQGAVQYSNGSGGFSNDNNFFWDSTNHRLGIGTGSPAFALQVNQSVALATATGGALPDATTAGIYFFTSGTPANPIFTLSRAGNSSGKRLMDFGSTADGKIAMRFVADDYSAATEWLTCTGSSTSITSVGIAGAIQFTNAIYQSAGTVSTDASGHVTTASDERLKDIQGKYVAGLQAVKALQPIAYKWNTASGLETQNIYAGFSAQNVAAAMPEATGVSPSGIMSLQDRVLIAALVNAVKELSTRIEVLEAQAGITPASPALQAPMSQIMPVVP